MADATTSVGELRDRVRQFVHARDWERFHAPKDLAMAISIEAEMGISRSDETSGLRGSDAIALWHAYRAGDDDALDLLLTYNLEDAVNLEPLAEFAYEALRSLCLDRGYVTADRYESDGQSVVR